MRLYKKKPTIERSRKKTPAFLRGSAQQRVFASRVFAMAPVNNLTIDSYDVVSEAGWQDELETLIFKTTEPSRSTPKVIETAADGISDKTSGPPHLQRQSDPSYEDVELMSVLEPEPLEVTTSGEAEAPEQTLNGSTAGGAEVSEQTLNGAKSSSLPGALPLQARGEQEGLSERSRPSRRRRTSASPSSSSSSHESHIRRRRRRRLSYRSVSAPYRRYHQPPREEVLWAIGITFSATLHSLLR
ncbi:uncharacterized protein Hap1MRO34_018045 isoform 2-T2 [Clarias gariepinus]|uniref:uncharacterized protein LOC128509652 isoform X3 n=1 Tax=Clarias gariepinus TaxID=13013 RepID=UPI00234DA8FC|nr:uncharacterized protein LOC128509652 isoform X3 [Clarias gariepinus]XP_053370311.1 uncharacterized protein LOC128544329 isoform X2 [Clarias gariepinus]